ncbi:hypothetical protein [Variovorax paradoxus]|uniref:hypothetical protein n=1 Tax=Variovorax paradoxus TaxID=34073 RepID=UPI002480CD33|nr:hypothetical protein [Variovorax paradoxus]WGT66022.1 hypothetical protein QHG62_11995 [Variovorax paradoxus]
MANASQLPKVPDNIPRADPDSPLPGFVTFAHLAARVGTTAGHLRVILSQVDAPRIEPSYRIGGAHLYNEAEANDWLRRLREWRDAAPLRAAARRKEQEQRVLLKLEEEQKKHRAKVEADAALKEMQDEYAARAEANRKDVEDTQRRMGLL